MLPYKRTDLIVLPTNLCNFQCKHCYTNKLGDDSVSLRILKKILKTYHKKLRYLIITGGGEPLIIFEKICEIINLAKKYKIKTHLSTNGYFINKDSIKKLRNLDEISLSVDTYHLKFISYSQILEIVRIILDTDIDLKIKISTNSKELHRNITFLKKLCKDIRGYLIKLTPLPKPYFLGLHYLIFVPHKHKWIKILIFDVMINKMNKRFFKGVKPMPLKKVIFGYCDSPQPTINFDSSFLPCCMPQAFNNSGLYRLDYQQLFIPSDPIMNTILFSKFPFAKIFLMIKKDKKLLKCFLNQKYYYYCDFCLEIFKNKKNILGIPQPTKYEMLIFGILNFHWILLNFIELSLIKFKEIFLEDFFSRVLKNHYNY